MNNYKDLEKRIRKAKSKAGAVGAVPIIAFLLMFIIPVALYFPFGFGVAAGVGVGYFIFLFVGGLIFMNIAYGREGSRKQGEKIGDADRLFYDEYLIPKMSSAGFTNFENLASEGIDPDEFNRIGLLRTLSQFTSHGLLKAELSGNHVSMCNYFMFRGHSDSDSSIYGIQYRCECPAAAGPVWIICRNIGMPEIMGKLSDEVMLFGYYSVEGRREYAGNSDDEFFRMFKVFCVNDDDARRVLTSEVRSVLMRIADNVKKNRSMDRLGLGFRYADGEIVAQIPDQIVEGLSISRKLKLASKDDRVVKDINLLKQIASSAQSIYR